MQYFSTSCFLPFVFLCFSATQLQAFFPLPYSRIKRFYLNHSESRRSMIDTVRQKQIIIRTPERRGKEMRTNKFPSIVARSILNEEVWIGGDDPNVVFGVRWRMFSVFDLKKGELHHRTRSCFLKSKIKHTFMKDPFQARFHFLYSCLAIELPSERFSSNYDFRVDVKRNRVWSKKWLFGFRDALNRSDQSGSWTWSRVRTRSISPLEKFTSIKR